MKIKKDDKVVVLSGKDKGKQGKVLIADPKNAKVVVEGVNVATKHQKPRKQGEEGGIIKVETPIYVSKVQLVCPKCGKATRVGFKVENGKKTRVGKVVSDKMDKTVVVIVEDRVAHKTYKKIIGRTYRLKAHDENNECGVGDIVRVMETRPLSKDKRWRVVEIVEKAK